MHPAEIQAALKIRGYSQSDIARECGIERTTVGHVVNGRSRSLRVETRISELTGMSLEKLWPQWHGDPGSRDLVLTEAERHLIERYRRLTDAGRHLVNGVLDQVLSGTAVGNIASGDRSVVATDNARVAQRDYIEGSSSKRRPKS